MASFDAAIIKTLEKEGGSKVTEIAGDSGGLTKFGISQRSYPALNIRNLTEQQARDIYKRDYWDLIRGDRIELQIVAESIFGAAVNMGVKTASKLAQTALDETMSGGIVIDGDIGEKTLSALNRCSKSVFMSSFTLAKIGYYAHICNRDKTQSKFLLGWINRALGGV